MSINTDATLVASQPAGNESHLARRLWAGFLSFMAALGTVWIFLLMFVVCADVIGRAVFSTPIHGVGTFAGYSIIGIAFLQLPEALYSGRMMRSDFFLNTLSDRSPRVGQGVESLFSLVSAVVFGLCAKVAVGVFLKAWDTSEKAGVEGLFTFSTVPFRFLIVLGMALCCLEALRQCLHHLAVAIRSTQGKGND